MTLSIKELRSACGMTQKAFAEYFGFAKRTLEDWEGGRRVIPPYLLDLIRYKLEHEDLLKQKDR